MLSSSFHIAVEHLKQHLKQHLNPIFTAYTNIFSKFKRKERIWRNYDLSFSLFSENRKEGKKVTWFYRLVQKFPYAFLFIRDMTWKGLLNTESHFLLTCTREIWSSTTQVNRVILILYKQLNQKTQHHFLNSSNLFGIMLIVSINTWPSPCWISSE